MRGKTKIKQKTILIMGSATILKDRSPAVSAFSGRTARLAAFSESRNHLYEIDFIISVGDKINPMEVKSGNYRGHKSLDVFCEKFSCHVRDKYVIHTKDYKWENGIHYLPIYMVPFL